MVLNLIILDMTEALGTKKPCLWIISHRKIKIQKTVNYRNSGGLDILSCLDLDHTLILLGTMLLTHAMHNLLLGTAKNMMAVWKDQSLICLLFNAANHRCNSCTCTYWPNSPYKIHSNLTSLNADQWKIWILEYSIFAIYSGLLFSCPAYVLVTN